MVALLKLAFIFNSCLALIMVLDLFQGNHILLAWNTFKEHVKLLIGEDIIIIFIFFLFLSLQFYTFMKLNKVEK
ncbi:hypothetical protein CJ195_11010 [Bacillus sp. UMB0899]|nr:hypothetical protein CJ195_11010 [Bacillus sp. UMB0899]